MEIGVDWPDTYHKGRPDPICLVKSGRIHWENQLWAPIFFEETSSKFQQIIRIWQVVFSFFWLKATTLTFFGGESNFLGLSFFKKKHLPIFWEEWPSSGSQMLLPNRISRWHFFCWKLKKLKSEVMESYQIKRKRRLRVETKKHIPELRMIFPWKKPQC